MIKIWERYIFREFIKLFALFLFGFYFLYIVIDYSTHMQDFFQGKSLPFWKIIQYYTLQFVKRADILLPLAILIAAIKTLCQLNHNRELIAFQSAGIRLKKLLRPLFFVGTLCTLFVLAVNEFAIPYSLNFIDKFYDSHLRHSFRGNRSEPLHVMHLEDHSKLAYQYYDNAKEAFFDVIWIRNADDLWHMKYLKADPIHPQGQWVDHLVRKEGGYFEKEQSFSSFSFRDLQWNEDIPRKGYIPYENRSITELWKLLKQDPLMPNHEKKEVLTQVLFKCSMPFLAFLVIIGIAPYCASNRQNLPQFFIYTAGIFGFVSFVAFMDAAVILGENGVLSPYVAILLPFVLLLGVFGWRFAK
ncbi:MAG: hypothetical protein K1000chlam2_00312 [Chlamydiae bacterium]|nr:hypothetical protein [Chlamydiota bacterium]